MMADPTRFIRPFPYMSFVWGADNQGFLRKRHAAMTKSHLFRSMELTSDHATIEGREYGSFPVSGQFLVCQNREIIEQYAMASSDWKL